jgi:hypothetical protein
MGMPIYDYGSILRSLNGIPHAVPAFLGTWGAFPNDFRVLPKSRGAFPEDSGAPLKAWGMV